MKKAFTLIELLVSVAILGIIMATSVVAFSSYTKRNLELSTQEIKTALEEAMTLSLSPKNPVAGLDGYGVCFKKTGSRWQYNVYQNLNGDHGCDSSSEDIGPPIDLRSGVDIQGIDPTSPSASTQFYIFFGTPQNVGHGSPADVINDISSDNPSLPYDKKNLWNCEACDFNFTQSGLIILESNSVLSKIRINNITGSINVE